MRSAGAPRAYLNDAAATSQVFRAGWTRMGDIGHLDADGYLFLVDRESDVIKSGADKVSTIAVEAALADVRRFLATRLAGHEQPSRIVRVAELPRNAGGKVVKSRLRALFDRAAPAAHADPAAGVAASKSPAIPSASETSGQEAAKPWPKQ
jgi:acyl-CoA synthetase (AMP-forming)/AMP-acid ligase II